MSLSRIALFGGKTFLTRLIFPPLYSHLLGRQTIYRMGNIQGHQPSPMTATDIQPVPWRGGFCPVCTKVLYDRAEALVHHIPHFTGQTSVIS